MYSRRKMMDPVKMSKDGLSSRKASRRRLMKRRRKTMSRRARGHSVLLIRPYSTIRILIRRLLGLQDFLRGLTRTLTKSRIKWAAFITRFQP